MDVLSHVSDVTDLMLLQVPGDLTNGVSEVAIVTRLSLFADDRRNSARCSDRV